jgi:hypothetical protein
MLADDNLSSSQRLAAYALMMEKCAEMNDLIKQFLDQTYQLGHVQVEDEPRQASA